MQTILLVGALAAWAALHSWLASEAVKTKAVALLGADGGRFYRLGYNVLSVVSLAPVAWMMRGMPDRQLYVIAAPWEFGMLAVQGLAVVLAGLTVLRTGALHFAGLAQIFGQAESSRLATTGLYKHVRHPLYLLGLIVLWLSPSMSLNQLVLTVMFSCYFFIGAIFEERRLLREFGAAYEAYRRRTPMILPRLGPRRV